MKVRAIKFGFYHHKREPGDVFEFEGKPSELWMEPVDAAAREAFKKAGFKVAPKPAPPTPPSADGEAGSKDKAPDPGTGGGSTGDRNVI
jgi:hypothetical protein